MTSQAVSAAEALEEIERHVEIYALGGRRFTLIGFLPQHLRVALSKHEEEIERILMARRSAVEVAVDRALESGVAEPWAEPWDGAEKKQEKRDIFKPYISASQITTWAMCPRRWAYRYVRGIKSPTSGAMLQGTAYHAGLEWWYREVIAGRKPTLEGAEEVCAKKLEESGFEDFLEDTLQMVRAHLNVISPEVDPLDVERKIVVDLGEEFPFQLLGYLDVITRDGWIRDNKSRSKKRGKPKQKDLDSDIQLTMYAMMYRSEFGRREAGLALDCVIKQGQGKPPITHIAEVGPRPDEQLAWLLGMITHMARSIYAEAYPPCGGPDSTRWWCSEKWCDYWGLCMIALDWPEGPLPRLRDWLESQNGEEKRAER